MAGVLTQSNSFNLTGQIGRRPTDAELYMAHFMGVGGATRLITAAENNPQASAASLFPNAAAANRSIFYDSAGSARSVSEVYAELTSRYDRAVNASSTQNAIAASGTLPAMASSSCAGRLRSPRWPTTPRSCRDFPIYAPAPMPRRCLQPARQRRSRRVAPRQSRSSARCTRAGSATQPVSNAVQELWGNRALLTPSTTSTDGLAQQPTLRAPQPLDLFSRPPVGKGSLGF